jgi:uncharacterized protein (DUF433 family)
MRHSRGQRFVVMCIDRRTMRDGEWRMAAVEIAPRIVVDEKVCFGKPVIKGTRVPVYIVLAKLAGGMTMEQVAEEYGITLEDIRAVLAYAASVIANETILPIPTGENR